MRNRTLFGCRSHCDEQAWRAQATGAVLPRGSLRTFSKAQTLSADAAIAHWRPRKPSRQSPYADRFRPLQTLARDPAGNQYTQATRWAAVLSKEFLAHRRGDHPSTACQASRAATLT